MCPKALERLTHRVATAKRDPEKMEPTTKLVIGIDIGGTKALTGPLAGAAVYKADKNNAKDLLSKSEVKGTVNRNPHVLSFASKEMDVKNLNSAVAKAVPKSSLPR